MSGADTSSLTNAQVRIHSVINRSLEVIKDSGRVFADEGAYRGPLRPGFIAYVRSFASVLYAHLLSEDRIVFPYFRDRLPETPFDLMRAQHEKIVSWLYVVQEELDEMEYDPHPSESLALLIDAAFNLGQLWYPHIVHEEKVFNARALANAVTPEEDRLLIKLMTDHCLANSGPDYLVVPFILYSLPPEERISMAQKLPPEITRLLLPGPWKQKWEVMAPFLSA